MVDTEINRQLINSGRVLTTTATREGGDSHSCNTSKRRDPPDHLQVRYLKLTEASLPMVTSENMI